MRVSGTGIGRQQGQGLCPWTPPKGKPFGNDCLSQGIKGSSDPLRVRAEPGLAFFGLCVRMRGICS